MLLLDQVRESVVIDFIRGAEAEKGEVAKGEGLCWLPLFPKASNGTLACLDTYRYKDTRKLL